MNKILSTTLLFLLMQGIVFGQSAWKLNTDKDGIKIYTSEVPDSKIKALKVECELHASPAQVVALLMDVNSSAEWVYHTKSCSVIKQVSPSELYYYSEVNLPWPAANRDFVAHLTVSQNPDTKVITIDGPAVPGMVAEKKGVVRIEHSSGRWILIPCGDHVKIEYTLHVEPGGNVPAWMVNMFATDGPMQIFKGMKLQLQKTAYRNATLASAAN